MTFGGRVRGLGFLLLLGVAGWWLDRQPAAHPLLQLAILTRYSLVIAIVPFLLGMLALCGFPVFGSVLRNLFVLTLPRQLLSVTAISLLLATASLVTFETTRINAPKRFADYHTALQHRAAQEAAKNHPPDWQGQVIETLLGSHEKTPGFWRWRWLLLAVIGLPIPVAALLLTRQDLLRPGVSSLALAARLVFNLLLGIGGWALLMFLTTLLQQSFMGTNGIQAGLFPLDEFDLVGKHPRCTLLDGVGTFVAAVLSHLGPGYAHGPAGATEVDSGHAQLLLFMALVLAGYLFWLFRSRTPPKHDGWFSALAALLTMVLLTGLVATGGSFLLDYFRLPLVVTLVLYSMVIWLVTSANSYYRVHDRPPSTTVPAAATIASILPQDNKTLVVVTAAGGGIQAAAWTARVLTGLHEVYGNDFTRSVGIVSAVSGGSVGALFYADALAADGNGLASATAETFREIRANAMRSSLEATAWGWAGWDTVKTVAPFIVPKYHDRGWAIEESWRRHLRNRHATLSDWTLLAAAGRLPLVIFNATAVENGKRFMIANGRMPDGPGYLQRRSDENDALAFEDVYPKLDVGVATAARLSATFPYVSPICRPSGDVTHAYHLADGGYVDNEGMVSAIDWLDYLLAARKFRNVLIVRILPFPSDFKEPAPLPGWFYGVTGPLQTMLDVRSTSQLERNHIALALLRKTLERDGIALRHAEFQFRLTNPRSTPPPLSWKLSLTEKDEIDDSWKAILDEARQTEDDPQRLDKPRNPFHVIGDWFPFGAPSP